MQLIIESENQAVFWHEEAPTLMTIEEDTRPKSEPLQNTTLPPVDGKFCLEKDNKMEEL